MGSFTPMSNSREGLHNSFPRVTLGIFSDFMLKSVGPLRREWKIENSESRIENSVRLQSRIENQNQESRIRLD